MCFQLIDLHCEDWENIYFLIIIIKSEVWTITHCLELGHETMVSDVCLYILTDTFGLDANIMSQTASVNYAVLRDIPPRSNYYVHNRQFCVIGNLCDKWIGDVHTICFLQVL